jgi:adenine-specific DNA methylase
MAKKSVKKSSTFNALKRKLAGKEDTVVKIFDDVKKVNPQQWKSQSQVEQLARKYIDKLGLTVPEERIKQFMSAYEDAMSNRLNTDELIQKYGKNVDKETLKTIQKYTSK